MMPAGPRGADVYTDLNGLAQLKSRARSDSPEALKETAQQFEALFLQMTLKNMRQAGEPFESKLVDGNGLRAFKDMHDQQMALQLSKNSNIGFADMLVKQLGHQAGKTDNAPRQGMGLDAYRHGAVRAMPVHKPAAGAMALGMRPGAAKPAFVPLQRTAPTHAAPARRIPPVVDKQEFLREMLPEAQAAAKELGVDPKLLLSQAALETGWGRHTVRRGDGSDSYNLFGIKARNGWEGRRVATTTLEYIQGVPVRKTDYFRAYDSYKDCFHDYVGFLRDNPRYAQAISQADDPQRFVAALQNAGYASDPRYASKVMAIYRQWGDFDVETSNIAAAAPATETPAAASPPAGPDPAQAPVADSSPSEPAPSGSGEEDA